MFCPECGFKNDDGAAYCARCAASLLADRRVGDHAQLPARRPTTVETHAVRGLRRRRLLVIRCGGGRAGETYALGDERLTIGRHPEAEIFLDDVTVSRDHAVVVREGDPWVIVDEGSLNGTYVNRRRSDRTVLTDGDEIQIGKYKLTFLAPAGS